MLCLAPLTTHPPPCRPLQLAQQREEVSCSIAALLEAHGDAALYDSAPWRRWLLQLDTPALLSCYLTYLCEGFQ